MFVPHGFLKRGPLGEGAKAAAIQTPSGRGSANRPATALPLPPAIGHPNSRSPPGTLTRADEFYLATLLKAHDEVPNTHCSTPTWVQWPSTPSAHPKSFK